METDILQTITITSFAPATLLLVWKILLPWSTLLIAKFNNTDTSSQGRLDRLENNDLTHMQLQIDDIETRMDDFQKQMGGLCSRLAVLEERTRK